MLRSSETVAALASAIWAASARRSVYGIDAINDVSFLVSLAQPSSCRPRQGISSLLNASHPFTSTLSGVLPHRKSRRKAVDCLAPTALSRRGRSL
jgi:hypothetical protein